MSAEVQLSPSTRKYKLSLERPGSIASLQTKETAILDLQPIHTKISPEQNQSASTSRKALPSRTTNRKTAGPQLKNERSLKLILHRYRYAYVTSACAESQVELS